MKRKNRLGESEKGKKITKPLAWSFFAPFLFNFDLGSQAPPALPLRHPFRFSRMTK